MLGKSLHSLLLLFALCLEFSAQSRYTVGCPEECNSCRNRVCRASFVRHCGVSVDCFKSNLTLLPLGIPFNVSGLLLSNNSIKVIDLNAFAGFSRLTTLLIDNNGAVKFTLDVHLRTLRRLSMKNNKFRLLPRKHMLKMSKLDELSLQHNYLKTIKGVLFPRKLEILTLNDNLLKSLTAGCFRKLKRLRVLKINDNLITVIKPRAFEHLISLEVLELGGNRIRELTDGVFSSLVNGFYLNLKNNKIASVDTDSFVRFGFKNENQRHILLDHNQLQFISDNEFGRLSAHKDRYQLYLAGNPLFCDCNFLNFRNDSKPMIADVKQLHCSLPPDYRGVSADDLYIESCCY